MTQTIVPIIPEDAPFTAAQKAWLNGFLAGLYSYALQPEAKSLRIAVLYGSQTGTAEGLARKLTKHLKASGYEAVLNSLEGYVPAALAAETHALFLVSTYGEGDAPDAAQAFFQQLCVEHFPLLGNLAYAVFALGDSHYEHFCQFGKDLDTKLSGLGGTRLLERVDCDVETDEAFASWKAALDGLLRKAVPAEALAIKADEPAQLSSVTALPSPAAASREHPFAASIMEKRALTAAHSTKRTIHLSFAIDSALITYEAGDACGVSPRNSTELVDAILELLPFTGDEMVEMAKADPLPLRQALQEKFAVARLTRNMVMQYAKLANCAWLDTLLAPEQQEELERYLHGRDLLDLLRACPGALQSLDQLMGMLPKLTPRLYSISSSPLAHPGQVHATVSVVRYETHGRTRGGVCSTLLDDRVEVGDRLPLYIHPNKKFRLPEDPAAPIIMIGPGTGIAPFRGFLHHRRAIGAGGRNWLFFGERSAATDFLYREELEGMAADGHLTQLDTAFSRDYADKVYVQDRMQSHARQLWAWLEEGAYVYVCGDAFRMAKDVDKTLHSIVETQGSLSKEAATEYLHNLREQRRYQRDVY